MSHRFRGGIGLIAAGCLLAGLSFAAQAQSFEAGAQDHPPALQLAAAQSPAKSPARTPIRKEAAMTTHASGTFEVKVESQSEDKAEGASLGRMSLDKQFHGGLEGSSKGEMLTAMSDFKGSAGYVAVERFRGSLDGRSGTFVLQHSGTMTRGTPQQSVTVVPDSGTGQLAGLAGTMVINIADGKHSYDFAYTIGGTR